MRILHVVPVYPGPVHHGSAVYHRNLHRALRSRGVSVSVACTRTAHFQHAFPFFIKWPTELRARDKQNGVPVRRFGCVNPGPTGLVLSQLVTRRWSREDTSEGSIVEGSSQYVAAAVDRANRRPRRYSAYADLGRGPISLGLFAYVARVASRFDAIIVGFAPFSLGRQVLIAARPSNTPVALLPFIHEHDRYHHFASLYDTYRRAAVVLTLSEHTNRFLEEYVPGCNAVALGAGTTILDEEPEQGEIEAFLSRHDLNNRRVLLFVGRKEAGKRYDLAVDALNDLPDDVVLVMIGSDVDGKQINSSRVRYLGLVSDRELLTAYAACDAFVWPSEHESFGMALLDAWKHGKPVIANRRCSAAEAIIDDGVDGLLAQDPKGIAAAVSSLLDDRSLATALGRAGRAKTTSLYTWDRVAERTIDALRSASHPRHAGRFSTGLS